MARFVIQSMRTHQFLHHNPVTGDVGWTPSLLSAMRDGIALDLEEVRQLVEDHCEPGATVYVDLDRDYE